MSLTLPAAWLEQAQRTPSELRFLATIDDGTSTWKATSGYCSQMSYPESVLSVSSLGLEMDVLTRQVTTGSTDVVFEDEFLRPIMVNNVLSKQKMTVQVGFASLAEASFVNYFVGPIERIMPKVTRAEVAVQCYSAIETLRNTKITGYWFNQHPLDVMYDIIVNKVALHSSLYNGTDFDPDNYTTISHFVVNAASIGGRGGFMVDRTIREPTSALAVLNEMAMLMNGTLHHDHDGKISFGLFDASASSVATWTEDEIIDPEIVSLDEPIINRVEFALNLVSGGAFGASTLPGTGFGFDGIYRQNDTDSQAAHAFPGASERILSHSMGSGWLIGEPALGSTVSSGSINDTDTSFKLRGPTMPCVCGTQVDDRAATGAAPTDQAISAARPLYLLTNAGEIIKVESLGVDSTNSVPMRYAITNENGGIDYLDGYASYWSASSATRGALGSTPAAATTAVDITIPVHIATRILERWGDGQPRVKFKTSMAEYAAELGDLVRLAWSKFIAYGHDGIEAADAKWEVVRKEFDPKTGLIEWEIVLAATATPTTTHTGWSQTTRNTFGSQLAAAVKNNDVMQPHVVSGLGVTAVSGLDVSVAAGVASAGIIRSELEAAQTVTVTASKDTYMRWDVATRTIVPLQVANGGTAPALGDYEVHLAKVVSDATTVTSIDTSTSVNTTAMDADRLIPASITSTQLGTAAVSEAKISTGAVTSVKMGQAAVGTYQMATQEKSANLVRNGAFSIATLG